jgi:hypothetical protein
MCIIKKKLYYCFTGVKESDSSEISEEEEEKEEAEEEP